ncbi:NAD(P)H-hydrate dehydratase [candidate division WOR-3 bacterium]|nr:NAD(P)H-hydrate dehydratase [candidate division WOR-3 bacterium]
MREADRIAISELGIPSLSLMENAGRIAAFFSIDMWKLKPKEKVLVIAGKGNNGGDAYVCARFLQNQGLEVFFFSLFDPSLLSKDALIQHGILVKTGLKIKLPSESDFMESFEKSLLRSRLVVDGIFGTGFKGKARDLPSEIIERVNASEKPVLSLDIASGINSDSGSVDGQAIKAESTVTFGCAKKCHFTVRGKRHCGNLFVADIGIPEFVLNKIHDTELLTCDMVKNILPKRDDSFHKNLFGKILIIGGSTGMSGAPVLSGKGALKTGSGYVTLALPSNITQVSVSFPEATYLASNEGPFINLEGAKKLIQTLVKYDAVVIGPGIGRDPETAQAVIEILLKTDIPAVVDADALRALAGSLEKIKGRENTVLTPHAGEFSALTDLSVEEIGENGKEHALNFAKKYSLTVHLKGPFGIVVCGKTLKTAQSPVMDSALATAGSGDVLSGIIASFLGRKIDAYQSASTGVFVHALAGITAKKLFHGVIASDICQCIPQAINEIERAADFGFVGSA